MLRALAWKEWREQRSVMLAGLGAALLMPFLAPVLVPLVMGPTGARIVEAIPLGLALLLWPAFAAAAGAATVANEAGDGTLRFLLSRPVARTRIWSVKVTAAAVAVTVVAAWSVLVASVLGWTFGVNAGVADILGRLAPSTFGAGSVLSVSLLLFASAVLCSTLLSRPLTAAAGSVALSLVILSVVLVQWALLSLSPRFAPRWAALEIAWIAAMILLASLLVFARAELLRSTGRSFVAALAAIGVAGVVVAGALPMFPASSVLHLDEAVIDGDSIVADGGTVAFEVTDAAGGRRQAWAVHSAGGGFIRLTGAGVRDILASYPWLLYFSNPGRSAGYELRAVRHDGGSDHRIEAGLGEPRGLSLAARTGRRFALISGSSVVVADPYTGAHQRIDVAGTELEGARLLGWAEAFGGLLFLRQEGAAADPRPALPVAPTARPSGPSSGAAPRFVIGVYDPATDRVRTLVEGAGTVVAPRRTRLRDEWGIVPLLVVAPDGATRLELVDVRSGETERVSESACGGIDVDLYADSVLWLECAKGGTVAVHLRNLYTDEQLTVATLDALEISSVTLFNRHVALRARTPEGGDEVVVVDIEDGSQHRLAPGWHFVDWAMAGRALVVDDRQRPTRIAIAIPGDDVYQIFPPETPPPSGREQATPARGEQKP